MSYSISHRIVRDIFTLLLFDGVMMSASSAVQLEYFIDGFSAAQVTLADFTVVHFYFFHIFLTDDDFL